MKLILGLLIGLLPLTLNGQQEFAEETIEKMETMGVAFLEPIDTEYKLKVPRKKKRQDELYGYDFSVHLDDRVVWVKLIEETETSLIRFPHLEFHRLLTHLASNEGESNIYIYDIPREEGVDWMSEARFTPKKKISKYKYGTSKVYYREGKGMIVLLYFDKTIQARFTPYAGFVENEGEG
jgi:hypothetical protein